MGLTGAPVGSDSVEGLHSRLLSLERLQKPVDQLLMHIGETYRQIQEEREAIDRILPTQHDGKCSEVSSGFWSRLEYLGDEMTGLIVTKTKSQRGLLEPIPRIRKPCSVQEEMGLLARKDAPFRYTWDRSLFLIYRRKELQHIMEKLGFSQQDIDGLEVVGRGQSFSTVTVKDFLVFEKSQKSSSDDILDNDLLTDIPDGASMPILGPSLLFCGKPACWIRGCNPQDKKQVGIAVRLIFETVERQKTSSELTVVNNGTVAIWYDWRRQSQPDAFRDLKRNRTQQFYFNNREGVILPGEMKTFTFFFKSVNAGIFREFWEFGTHPTLLGGAVLQVNLYAVSLAQDIYSDERSLLEKELASHEAVTVAQSVLQELLGGVLTPERVPSPVDAYLTEEDLFYYRNPQLHYQHQTVQNLHRLWYQYMVLPYKAEEGRPSDEEPTAPRAWTAKSQTGFLDKVDSSPYPKSPASEPQQESPDAFRPQRVRLGSKVSQRKSIMEEILVEGGRDGDSTKSPWEQAGLPPPEWNLCLEDFRKAAVSLSEESQREDALIRLNKAALELCQGQRPLQSDFLYQMCFQLWRDVIDSLVGYSLWLRALLGLPEKETIYLDMPEEIGRKTPSVVETKVAPGRAGKEDRRAAAQERKLDRVNSRKQKAKDDKKPAKSSSRDRVYVEDHAPDTAVTSREPIDPLVMEKYTQRMCTEVYGLLDTMVMNFMILADELNPQRDIEEHLNP